MPVAFLPSPIRAVWHLGPLPVRAYALCNEWVMALVFAGALGYLYLTRGRPGGAAAHLRRFGTRAERAGMHR